MACHEGVSCDVCGQSSFRGPRYKCLRCYDYDLCSACFDAGRISNRHAHSHPMQCILTRIDCEVFYMGESVASSEAGIESFTCPFCGTLGFTRSSLATHVTDEHADTEALVICPVCASHPTGDPNYQTPDMGRHLAYDHPPAVGNENSEGNTVVPAHSAHLFSRALTGGSSMGLRPTRRVGRGGGVSGGTGGSGPTSNSCPATMAGVSTGYSTVTNSSAPSTRGGRSRPSATTTTSGGTENLNAGMDPIAELLSHLSTVRSRAAMPLGPGGTTSTSNQAMNLQLAQLELQLAETTQAVQMANAVLAGNRAALAGRFSFGTAIPNSQQSTTENSAQKSGTRDAAAASGTGNDLLKREDVDLMEETSRIDQDLLLAQYLNSVDRTAEELAYQLNRAVFLEELLLDSTKSESSAVDTNCDLGTNSKWDRPS